MAVNGKSKGSTFERKIANLLSERFEAVTGIEKSFRRNPDSGSFFGGTNKKRTQTYDLDHANFGDLICPTNFKYSVECKHYAKGPTFTALVKGQISQWDDWLDQARQDAEESKKQMMLIIKYNGVDEIVFLSETIAPLTLIIPYKNVYGYRLKDVLGQPDTTFFDLHHG